MNQIIISQSNIYLASLFLLTLFFGFATFIGLIVLVDSYEKEKSLDAIISIFTIFALSLTIASSVWLLKQGIENHRFRNGSDRVTKYYDLKKNRSLIIATKKSSAPDWLAKNAKAKIIYEDEKSYQVQFKEMFAEVDKKDVK